MKKMMLCFYHFRKSNGVARAALNMANSLSDDFDITLRPLFISDPELEKELSPKVSIKPVFGFHFKGLNALLRLIPSSLLYRLIVRNSYDIVVAYQYDLPTRTLHANKHDNSVRLCWIHGYDERMVLRKYYPKYDAVVCVSKGASERLSEEYKGNINSHYLYNIVDEKVILQQAAINTVSKPEIITFVSVGRLSPEKGFFELLGSIKQLRDDGLKFHLWLVGGGPEKSRLIKYIEENNLSSLVTLFGTQNNPHRIVHSADIFVCSSFSEGYNTAVNEAAIMGVPVISTNVGGAQEVFELQESGLVVDDNGAELYKALKKAIRDPDIVSEWKEKAQKNSYKFYKANRLEAMRIFFMNQEKIK
ncbi:MAG: glycosyltransferase [Sphaerochaetaceae bacterium]